jgi:flagellar export protein FliJ
MVKSFTFELDKVLKFKQHREQAAEVQQKQAAMALQAAHAKVSAIGEQLDELSLRLQTKLGKAQVTTTWIAVYLQSALLEQALQIARQDVERAARQFEKAAAARKQAAIEVETLLTLRGQKWHEFLVESERALQVGLDEIGVRRWIAARRGKPGQNETEGTET